MFPLERPCRWLFLVRVDQVIPALLTGIWHPQVHISLGFSFLLFSGNIVSVVSSLYKDMFYFDHSLPASCASEWIVWVWLYCALCLQPTVSGSGYHEASLLSQLRYGVGCHRMNVVREPLRAHPKVRGPSFLTRRPLSLRQPEKSEAFLVC